MSEQKLVNGKYYPMWQQFVDRASEWKGKRLQDLESVGAETVIENITLKPNGKESAFFEVGGKDFDCGFDVGVGGVTGGEEGWITFSGYGSHIWRIESLTIK